MNNSRFFSINTVSDIVHDSMKTILCSDASMSYFIYRKMFERIDKGDVVYLLDSEQRIIEYQVNEGQYYNKIHNRKLKL